MSDRNETLSYCLILYSLNYLKFEINSTRESLLACRFYGQQFHGVQPINGFYERFIFQKAR